MSGLHWTSRRLLIAIAFLCGAGSIALFVFRPVPPIGLAAAFGLVVETLSCLWLALFPKRAMRIQRRIERMVDKEPEPIHPGNWVP